MTPRLLLLVSTSSLGAWCVLHKAAPIQLKHVYHTRPVAFSVVGTHWLVVRAPSEISAKPTCSVMCQIDRLSNQR